MNRFSPKFEKRFGMLSYHLRPCSERAKTSPSLLRTYEMAKKVRLLIRKDRLNRLISAE